MKTANAVFLLAKHRENKNKYLTVHFVLRGNGSTLIYGCQWSPKAHPLHKYADGITIDGVAHL